MESHSVGFFTWLAEVSQLKLLLIVVPDVDGSSRAGDDELLPQTDVHASDLHGVEGTVDWLCGFGLDLGVVKINRHLEELVGSINIIKVVFSRVENHRDDVGWVDLLIKVVLESVTRVELVHQAEVLTVIRREVIEPNVTFLTTKDETMGVSQDAVDP